MRRRLLSLLCCAMLSGLAAGQATTTSGPTTAPGTQDPSHRTTQVAERIQVVDRAVLGFRIAPFAPGRGDPNTSLSESDRDRYVEMFTKEGPYPARLRNEPYLWFPLRKGEKKIDGAVVAEHDGHTFILLSNQPGEVMLQDGPSPWGLKGAFLETDQSGRPAVGFEFDAAGAKLFGELTADHIGQLLAILVNDEVYSCPIIRSVITERGVIEGNFTRKEVLRLLGRLRDGMRRFPVGRVFDAQGHSVAGATVEVIPSVDDYHRVYRTSQDGAFPIWAFGRIVEVNGSRDVEQKLLIRHVERNLAGLADLPDMDASAEVVLSPGLTLSCEVVDAKGQPIPDAEVAFDLYVGNDGMTLGAEPVRTDPNGHAQISAVPHGAHIRVHAQADGYGFASRTRELGKDDSEPVALGTLVLPEAKESLAGVVLDSNNHPVPGAIVFVVGRGQPRRDAVTDRDGRFTIGNVVAGYIQVYGRRHSPRWSAQERWTMVSATGGDQNVKIVLGAGGIPETQPVRQLPQTTTRATSSPATQAAE